MPVNDQSWEDQLLSQMRADAQPTGALRQSLSYGVTQDPDQYAKQLELQRQTGVPPQVQQGSEDQVQQAARLAGIDYAGLAQNNPKLTGFLSNPDNAAVAHDDLDSLSRIEQGSAELRAWNPTLWERVKMKLADAFTATTDTTPTQAVRNIYNSPARLAPDVVGGAAGFAGNIGSFYLGWHGSGPTRENLLQRVDTLLSPESVFKNDPYADAAPYMKSNTGDMLAKNAGPLIASMFVSGGTSEIATALKLSPTAGKVLTALMVGSMFSADQGGQTFTQMSAAGKSDAEARRDALLTSALTLVPNTAMGLTDFAPWLKRNPLLASLGVGGATGATGQLAQNVVTGQPWQTDLGKSMIQGAAVMGGMHIGMGGFEPEAPGAPGVAEGPKTFQQTLAGMVDDAERSKLRTRLPEAFQQSMNANFEGDDSLRVPAQDFVNYFAGKKLDPAAAANELGVTNLAEAATAGSDLEIPKANFFGKLDPEHQKGLLPDVIDPSTELTARQTEAGLQELEQRVSSSAIEQLAIEYAAADAETQATPGWQAVKSELKQRYAAAGETETAAEDLSTVHANLARNAGLKPDELLALHNPNIVAAEAAPGALYQSEAPGEGVDRVLDDARLRAAAPKPVLDKLAESADAINSFGSRPDEWNLLPGIRAAVAKLGSVHDEEEAANPVVDALAQALNGDPKAAKKAFENYAADAKLNSSEKATTTNDAHDAFNRAFGVKLKPEEFHDGLESAAQSENAAGDADLSRVAAGSEGAGGEEPGRETGPGAAGSGPERDASERARSTGEPEPADGHATAVGGKRGWFRILPEWQAVKSELKQRYAAAGETETAAEDLSTVHANAIVSENAVDLAQREAPEKLFENPEEAGWTEAEYKNYADAYGNAADKAKAEVQRELNEAAVRERTPAWREEKGNVRDAVTEEIDARPEYKAIRSLRRGKTDLGTDLTLNRDELVKQFGEERVKALQDLHRGLYRQEGGTDAETASELLGFGSGEEMMRSMENAPRRAQAIEAATRDYMTEKYGDIRYDGSLDNKARLALANDERAKSVQKEVGALRARVAVLEKRAADTKAAMAAITLEPLDHYQEAAKAMIDQKAIADLQPIRYLNASRKFSREAFDAARKGDPKAALEAKNKELLNHYMFREASAARDYADKFERERVAMQKANFQQKLALAGSDYREQFNWLGARNRMWAPTGAPERSLSAWADDMHDRGNELELAPSVLSENKFQDYRSIPLAEVRELHDALVNIRHLAMREFKMFVGGKQVEFASGRTAMIERAHETGTWKPETVLKEEPTRLSNLAGYLRSVDTANTRMEYEIVDLDGGTQGPWHDNLWNLYENAKGDEYGLQHEVTKSLADLVGERSTKEGLRLLDKVTVDGIPTTEPVTRKTLVSMALNIGNDGNRDRLEKTFDHHSWDRKVIDQLAGNKGSPGLLTADEWRFTQRAWDTFKPLGVRMVEMMRRLVGLPPKMVTVTPFDVYLADGTVMHMEGGYYPIVADEEKSLSRGYQQDASKTAGNLMEKGYLRASTATGYTKERQGYGGPILLDYERVLTSSLAKEVKDISHREVMLVANKFLTDPDIRRTLRERRGPGADERFSSWLRAIVNDRNGSLDFGANDPRSAIESLRINLVKAGLCFKASTAIQQITHLSRIMLFTKPGPFMQSMVDFWKDPAAMTQAIRELSPNEMRFRGENLSRDYRAALNDVAGKTGTLARASRLGMAAFKYEDHVVSFPLWHSVYNESMRRNAEMPEEQARPLAVHDADAAVRMGMGTGATGDLPPIMRSNDELLKLETTLFGFHNLNYQILRHKVLGAATRDFRAGNYVRGAANLTGGAALAWIIPALVGSLVTGNGPKDGENAGLWAAKRSLFFAGGTIPFLKDIVSAFEYGSVNPVVNYAKAITGAAEGIASKKEDKDWTELGINSLELGGEGLGLPGTEQAAHTARYVHRASQGKIANPSIYGALVAGR